jgi:hypothetical protein
MGLWTEREWLIWVGWISTYSVGWVVSLSVLFARAMLRSDAITPVPMPIVSDILNLALSFGIVWSIMSIVQWPLLRAYWRHPGQWIGASTLGWTWFWVLPQVIPEPFRYVTGLFSCLGLSVVQWVALHHDFAQPRWWQVLGALLGTGCIWWALDNLVRQMVSTPPSATLLVALLPGTIYGGLIGLVLTPFVRQASEAPHPGPQ